MSAKNRNGALALSLAPIHGERDTREAFGVSQKVNKIASSIRLNFIPTFESIVLMNDEEMDAEILEGVLDGNKLDFSIIEDALNEEKSVVKRHSIASSIRLHDACNTLDEEESEEEDVLASYFEDTFFEDSNKSVELSPDLKDSLVSYVTDTVDNLRDWADDLMEPPPEQTMLRFGHSDQSMIGVSERIKEKMASSRDFEDYAVGTLAGGATNRDSVKKALGKRQKDKTLAEIEKAKADEAFIASSRELEDISETLHEVCPRRKSIMNTLEEKRKAKAKAEAEKAKADKAVSEPRRRNLLVSLIMSRKFVLFRNRYANAQFGRTLHFPTLPQPPSDEYMDNMGLTEMTRTRPSHRFIITADTQFGILMDGFEMENPSWQTEIEISRECVKEINAMKGSERPLYVCVCGDLIDTEGSFSKALASWKQVFKGWERQVIAQQQMKDFKDVWSLIDEDIGLVCLCGNHDVGNRPTAQSIQTWTSAFGNDYLAFWVNGTYNIGMNNCIFSDPSGAMDLYEEQLAWLEERLEYASEKKASQIFVYSHFPWFIAHEDEEPHLMPSASIAPVGWGPPGMKFTDSYFNIPIERRKIVLALFRKYNVKACFSGHFHQNVVSKTEWGMDMIITGPLSMMLKSTGNLSLIEEKHTCGMRVVDVHENSFEHKFVPIENNMYCHDCNLDDEDPVLKPDEKIPHKKEIDKRNCWTAAEQHLSRCAIM